MKNYYYLTRDHFLKAKKELNLRLATLEETMGNNQKEIHWAVLPNGNKRPYVRKHQPCCETKPLVYHSHSSTI